MNNNILPIGTFLNDGAYRIEEHLGSGGFGNTYKVTHVPSGKIFAAKEFFKSDINLRVGNTVTVSVPSNNATFESFKKKFVKEAQRMKTLNSQHIVRCTDVFPENGTYYYVMDFIDGESLQAYINRVGKLSKEKALSIFEQLLEALQVAHSQTPQLYHLDIKPANIMLDKKGNAYLIDFGASKLSSIEREGVTSTSLLAYSKGYAPSELIEANFSRIGPWTDFYEMGALLYYMLMKKLPPTSSDLTNGEDFSFSVNTDRDIQNLIVWLMQPGTKKRPQAVKEIRAYLIGHEATSSVATETITIQHRQNLNEITIIEEKKRRTTASRNTHYSQQKETKYNKQNFSIDNSFISKLKRTAKICLVYSVMNLARLIVAIFLIIYALFLVAWPFCIAAILAATGCSEDIVSLFFGILIFVWLPIVFVFSLLIKIEGNEEQKKWLFRPFAILGKKIENIPKQFSI